MGTELNKTDVHIEYRTLFIICRYCFMISILIIPVSIAVFFRWPLYPDNILDIITADKAGGILSLDFLYFIGTFLSIPILLFYYLTTKESNKSLSLLAAALGFTGLVCLYSSRPVSEMIGLGDMYARAEPESQKELIREMSRFLMLYFRGTAFHIHYIIGNLSLLIFSFLMFRNRYYTNAAAWAGIITIILSFTYFIPGVGVYIATVSVIGYIVWWVLMIIRIRNVLGESKPEI